MRLGRALSKASIAAATALLLSAVPAEAAPVRCVDPVTKKVTYQEAACPVVQAAEPVRRSPPCPLTAEELRAAIREEEQFRRRYPTERRHAAERTSELQTIAARLRGPTSRFHELRAERKKIDEELAFYQGKAIPVPLQGRLDASNAAFTALADLFRGIESDLRTTASKFDCDHQRMKGVWNDAPDGSSGCMTRCKP